MPTQLPQFKSELFNRIVQGDVNVLKVEHDFTLIEPIYYPTFRGELNDGIITKSIIYAEENSEKWDVLSVACAAGHLNLVEQLLGMPLVSANVGADNNLALRMAAGHGHINIVNRLLEIDAVINHAAAKNNEALRAAAFHGHAETVKRLLRIEAVSDNVVAGKNQILIHAAKRGNLNLVEKVIKKVKVITDVEVDDNMWPYCKEAWEYVHLVDDLLEIEGARDNFSADTDEARSFEAGNNHQKVLRLLLETVSMSTSVAVYNMALKGAAANDHIKIVNRLLDIPQVMANAVKDKEVMRLATERGHVGVVNRLLELPEARAAVVADNNLTLGAVSNGHIKVVNRLLRIPEVSANAAADFANTALRWAATNGHLEVVNRLLEIDAVMANAAVMNNEALRVAAQSGHIDVVNRLLKINEVSANAAVMNNEALIMAAANGHLKVVKRLLEINEVSANAAAGDNYALRVAAENGHSEVAHAIAKAQWPLGKQDMPDSLFDLLPSIRKGALLFSGENEAKRLLFCWMQKKPHSKTSHLYSPYATTLTEAPVGKYNTFNIASYIEENEKDLWGEEKAEDCKKRACDGMEHLLYSSRLHSLFQTAYERGKAKTKAHHGYGEGAMVVYQPG